jgi:predicted TIM-barrel enzyme
MPRIYTVIHHLDGPLTLEEAELSRELGADGVFLISHAGEDMQLPPLARKLSTRWAAMRTPAGERPLVGLNLLTVDPLDALAQAVDCGAQALWVGPSGIGSHEISAQARQLAGAASCQPQVTVLAGVAFKYQAHEPDPPAAARACLALGMLPVTSGAGTGSAPSVDKIRSMSEATGGQLAVASGMTVDNVAQFAPYLSHILVATGVTREPHHIDAPTLKQFLASAREGARG